MSNATTQHTPADAREPTDAQINVWSIIRSALSRAWALSRPWAVADRPQVTSEVVARLDAIAADCEREVLTALRTPSGEGERGLIMRAMLETFPWSPDIRQEHFERAADAVIAALRTEAQGEGWQVTEPDRDIVRREMPETRATVREAIRAARRGEGGE